ncbi:hypothetical protein [Actinoplanes sp. ATCC 53533]|uniref:hypothetical protein n=1 Tax=Actinoplanes sp. ATCC 53533 TaxID=1288362 RepID=UPI000F775F69|nr:hypothetical protein [Actinoplanes sp. ATCC 53533]
MIDHSGGHQPCVRIIDVKAGSEYYIGSETRILRRRPAFPTFGSESDLDPGVKSFIQAQYRNTLNMLFASEAVWMNPVGADRRFDQNKVLGSHLASRVGMECIPTVLTDSPAAFCEAVQRFTKHGDDIAVKPTGAWSAVIDNDYESVLSLFTSRLDGSAALGMAEAVSLAPVFVQPYVDKAYELRVTVVADEIFTCRIESQATERTQTDWRRYDLPNTPHSPAVLDASTTSALRSFMESSALVYAAFDFIVTRDYRTIFVEVNPAGQFGWIEELTGLKISDAIVDWLTAGNA